MKHHSKNQDGYIALITVIIISAILEIMAISSITISYNTGETIFNTRQKEESLYAAEACIERTRLKIIDDPGYLGNDTTAFGSYPCTIMPIQPGSQMNVMVTASAGNSYSHLKATIDPVTGSTTAVTEVFN